MSFLDELKEVFGDALSPVRQSTFDYLTSSYLFLGSTSKGVFGSSEGVPVDWIVGRSGAHGVHCLWGITAAGHNSLSFGPLNNPMTPIPACVVAAAHKLLQD